MRKLAFEHAGVGFEMPSLRMVNLEKENSNIAFAKVPKTVYKGSTFSYSRAMALKMAADNEVEQFSDGSVKVVK
ncbi:MAG: hypothetical protein IKW60_02670 [Clostridia bacterium]|nr:hypothetical protein [Clostridia bacterium]